MEQRLRRWIVVPIALTAAGVVGLSVLARCSSSRPLTSAIHEGGEK